MTPRRRIYLDNPFRDVIIVDSEGSTVPAVERRTCENCEFWVRDLNCDADGRCHRFPPRDERYWPLTRVDNWCGEWSRR